MAKRKVRTGGGYEPQAGAHEEQFSAFGGHPLQIHVAAARSAVAAVAGAGGALTDLGITDAEQLVAVAATDSGREGLTAALGVRRAELDALVEEARRILPPPRAAE